MAVSSCEGREPAEDAKRRFLEAVAFVGLKPFKTGMFKFNEKGGRFVFGGASPEGWPNADCPAISMHVMVFFNGDYSPVEIRCDALDRGDPLTIFDGITVRNCRCDLSELPETLKALWDERQRIAAAGGDLTHLSTHWTWERIDFGNTNRQERKT